MSRILVITLLLLVFGLTASGEEAAKAQSKDSPVEIERLIKQLGSDRFAEREAASKALKDIGQPALDALRKATKGNDLEVRRRAELLVEMVQRLFKLPMQVAFLGNEEFSPCCVDLHNKTLYRWKGVILRREQMLQTPYGGVPSGVRVLNAKDFSVVPIEAPVKYWYWKDGEGYRPGYLDRAIWTFYAWKGIVLNEEELFEKSQDGQDAIVKPAFPSQVIGVLEIDMPAHLKEHPELWKKGGAYTPEASIRAEKRAAAKKAAERKAAEVRARDPRVLTLLVRVTAFGENDFRPCYYDPKNRSLYPWKGVILRLEQLPNAYKERRIVTLITSGLSVVSVDAPVSYREVNGKYRPGYLDGSLGVFYEWKGVALSKQEVPDKSKDGQDAVVKPDKFSQVIEIDMPVHLKEHPELWKSNSSRPRE